MSYVDSQLLPNETVLYRARLHRSVYSAAFSVATLALIAAAVAIYQPPFWWAALVLGVISVMVFVPAWLRSKSSEFAVTDKRVIIKVGWIRRRTLETMLAKVEGIGVDQTLSGRMLGFGTMGPVRCESAIHSKIDSVHRCRSGGCVLI